MNDGKGVSGKVRLYWELSRARAREGHKSTLRQWAEMAALAVVTGNGPGFYQMAGFWRESVSWREKCAHLNAKAYRRRVRALNPSEYRKITQNKLPEKGLLSLLGFPTPEFVGYLHPALGRTASGAPLRDGKDLARMLRSIEAGKLCFKPVEGWGGKGVEMIEVVRREEPAEPAVRRLRTGQILDADRFVGEILARNAAAGMLVERFLEQHPAMAAFNPSSVNTCRAWVVRDAGGDARVVLAYLRVGRGGAIVDNQSSGGIVAPIDLDTGATGVAIDGLPTRAEYVTHPDHGAPIAGRTIPHWSEVLATAAAAIGAVPRLRFAGLDVAVGLSGPVILELNASPDREGAAFAGIPSGDVLPTQ
jgi:hypothetical protein